MTAHLDAAAASRYDRRSNIAALFGAAPELARIRRHSNDAHALQKKGSGRVIGSRRWWEGAGYLHSREVRTGPMVSAPPGTPTNRAIGAVR